MRVWRDIARLRRSNPDEIIETTTAVDRRIRHELDLLRPGVLLVYRAIPAAALRRLGSEHGVDRRGKRFPRMGLGFDGWACTAFMLTHPAHGGWDRDHALLQASLAGSPIAET
ncbi:MAG TPA: hypothetical protein VGD16_03280 [Enterovirga sp.]